MPSGACVTEDSLRAFTLGEINDRLADAIAEHLESCPACEGAVRRLDALTDVCIRSLREDLLPVEGKDALTLDDDASAVDASAVDAPPRAVGPGWIAGYEIVEELGRGGMSVVYRARQLRPRREVALKMILAGPHAATERHVRFLAEADAIARLHHPHIVHIYEVGEHDGLPILSLEYVAGGTLGQHARAMPMAPARAAALVEKLAHAVQYAHQCGVIHRDLKPANVLLTLDGEPKIADFGLAKQDRPDLTATGAVLGTPAYMAPEQALGDNAAVGPAADVYALGAILYELLTGQAPFGGATPLETLDAVRRREPVSPRQLRPKTPRDLTTICLKCLRKEPGRRYESAQALADDLRAFRDGKPIQARPVGTLERAARWARRNPGWAAMATALAGLLLVIAGGASFMSWQLAGALAFADENLAAADAQRARALEAERAANARLWEAYLAQAQMRRLDTRLGRRTESLAAIRKALALPLPPDHSRLELRNAALACLVLPDIEVVRDWPGRPAGTGGVAVDAAYHRYARADAATGTVSLRRISDDVELACLPGWGKSVDAGVGFSPDGRFFRQHCGPGRFKIWRVDRPNPDVVVEGDHVYAVLPAFSADSRFFAALARVDTVCIYDLATGREVRRLRLHLVPDDLRALANDWTPQMLAANADVRALLATAHWAPPKLAFRPKHPQLAVVGGKTVHVIDAATGKVVTKLTHPEPVTFVHWRTDGTILATGAGDRKIRLWNVDRGECVLPPLEGHGNYVVFAEFMAGGDRLLSNDWNDALRLWDARSGTLLLTAHGTQTAAGSAAGDSVLAVQPAEQRLRQLRVIPGREVRALPAPDLGGYRHALGSRDGRFLLVSTPSEIRVLDWARGTCVARIPMPESTPFAIAPTGDVLIHSLDGVFRCPLRVDPDHGVSVGPLVQVYGGNGHDRNGCNADATLFASPTFSHVVVNKPPAQSVVISPCDDVRCCAVSPDGSWVAGGNHSNRKGVMAYVWDVRNLTAPKLVKEFPGSSNSLVGFSPNGRWLMTTGDRYCLWHAGSWQPGPVLGPCGTTSAKVFAFTPDSSCVAVAGVNREIGLYATETGRELGRLTAPDGGGLRPQCFSPDGAELVATGSEGRTLYIFDLRRLRVGLHELGLDWEAPAYPPAPPVLPVPIRVRQDTRRPAAIGSTT